MLRQLLDITKLGAYRRPWLHHGWGSQKTLAHKSLSFASFFMYMCLCCVCILGCLHVWGAHMCAGPCVCMWIEAWGWRWELPWVLSIWFTGVGPLNWTHADDLANELAAGPPASTWTLESERDAVPTQQPTDPSFGSVLSQLCLISWLSVFPLSLLEKTTWEPVTNSWPAAPDIFDSKIFGYFDIVTNMPMRKSHV